MEMTNEQLQPHEVFADAVREAVASGSALVASGELKSLAIRIEISQAGPPAKDIFEVDGDVQGHIRLHVEFDPPLNAISEGTAFG